MFFTTFGCDKFIYYLLVIMYSDTMDKLEEIRKKIEKLEKEGKELKQMRKDANTLKYIRKISILDGDEYKVD